jgi:hypothetical protein
MTTDSDPLRRFNSDPDALAWARAAIQREVDRLREWQQQCIDKGETERAQQWKKMANLLEIRFIGGKNCVIAAFDHRKPAFAAMFAAAAAGNSEAT